MNNNQKMLKQLLSLDDKTFQSQLDVIEKFLNETSVLYEQGNETGVSDEEWDTLQIRYSRFKDYSFGSSYNADVEHFMQDNGGISNKIQNETQIGDLLVGLDKRKTYTILASPKLDGQSIMFHIGKDGEVVNAMTRGKDGKGTSLTHIFKSVKPFGDKFLNKYVRCEAVFNDEGFNAYKFIEDFDYKDKRSSIPGLIRKLQFGSVIPDNYLHLIKFVPFYYENIDGKVSDLVGMYEELYQQDFANYIDVKISFNHLPTKINEIMEMFAKEREQTSIMWDGVVFYVMEEGDTKGSTLRFAYKFKQFECETELLGIEWDFSPTSGTYTPMGLINVEHAGRAFSRVSLSSAGRLIGLDFRVGDKVKFEYRSDVMGYLSPLVKPRQKDNLQHPNLLINCVHCNEKLILNQSRSGEYTYFNLLCDNIVCSGSTHGYILNHATKMGMKGINEATLERVVKSLNITNIIQLYHIDASDLINSGFGEKQSENIINSINSINKPNDYELLGSLNIPSVSRGKSKQLLEEVTLYELINDFATSSEKTFLEKYSQVDGFQNISAKHLHEGLGRSINDLYFLYQHYDFICTKSSLDALRNSKDVNKILGKTFVVTGSVESFTNRDELKKFIEENGGKLTGSVTSNTNYLINNDVNSSSSKNKRARELSIPIITDTQLKNQTF